MKITIVSFVIGVVGLLVAIWQTVRVRNTRLMYKEKCETRAKDLVETTKQLAQSVTQACRIKDEHLDDIMAGRSQPETAMRPLRQLSDQIHSIDVEKNHLVRFCERLDDEHFEEFGTRIFSNLRGQFPSYSESRIRDIEFKERVKRT